MDKRKIFGVIVLGVSAIAAGILIKKRFDESEEEYEKVLSEKKEHYREIGLSEEQSEEIAHEVMSEEPVIQKESTTIRALRLATSGAYDIYEHLDIRDAGITKPVIHVKADYTNTGFERINIIYQLPNYLSKAGREPKLGDYKRAIAGVTFFDESGKQQVKEAGEVQELEKTFGFKPLGDPNLVGFAILKLDNPEYDPEDPSSQENIFSDIVEIPEEIYEDYSYEDDKGKIRGGLTKFYEAFQKDDDVEEETRLRFVDYMSELGEISENIEIEGVFLGFKVTYEGLNFEDVAKLVHHSVNELEVTRQGITSNAVMFDTVLYHAPYKPEENPDANMSLVYTYREGSSQIIVKDLLLREEE